MAAWRWCGVACSVVGALAGCGGGGGGGGETSPGPVVPSIADARYFPLAVGDRRRYATDGQISDEQVVRTEAVAEGTAYVVRSVDGTEVDETYYVVSTGGVAIVVAPNASGLEKQLGAFQLATFPLQAGNRHVAVDRALPGVADFDGDGRADNYSIRVNTTVVGFDFVSTAAGAFNNALHLRMEFKETFTFSSDGGTFVSTTVVDEWYALDVGLVRSVSNNTYRGVTTTAEQKAVAFKVGVLASERVVPTVVSVTPTAASWATTGVMTLAFSEAMNWLAVPLDKFKLLNPEGQIVPGEMFWDDDRTLRFVATGPLPAGQYQASLEAGVEDLAGNGVATTTTWRFGLDTAGPVLVSMFPASSTDPMPLDGAITLTFNEPIAQASLTPQNFRLYSFGGAFKYEVSQSGNTVSLTPRPQWVRGAQYVLEISSQVQDLRGNHLEVAQTLQFQADPGLFALPQWVTPSGPVTAADVVARALVDMNGDGRLDVVMKTGDGCSTWAVQVYLQRAEGGFDAVPWRLPLGCGFPSLTRLLVVDVDGDGRPDVLLQGLDDRQTRYFRQVAPGQFEDRALNFGGALETTVALRLQGEARPALVGVDGSLKLWRPQGQDALAPPEWLLDSGVAVSNVQVGDIDGDGLDDFAAFGFVANVPTLFVGLQRPGGTFALSSQSLPIAAWGSLVLRDFNGDGRLDVLLGTPAYDIYLMTHQSGAVFNAPDLLHLRLDIGTLAVADANADGRLDLVYKNVFASVVMVQLQQADGSFAQAQRFPGGSPLPDTQGAVLLGDVTGDGRADIVVGNLFMAQRVVPSSQHVRARPLLAMLRGGGVQAASRVVTGATGLTPRCAMPQRRAGKGRCGLAPPG